jgi:hypothetical protein
MKTANPRLTDWLFQPQRYISGNNALWIGSSTFLLAGLFAWLFNGRYDGFLDFHLVNNVSFTTVLSDMAILLLLLLLLPGGYIFWKTGRKHRWQDVVGFLLLSRSPMMLLPWLNLGGFLQAAIPSDLTEAGALEKISTPFYSLLVLLLAAVTIAISIWHLLLLYRSMALLTQKKDVLPFVLLVIVAEWFSKILINTI